MKNFKSFSDDISYKDVLQLDGAFATAHINYGKSPLFNNFDGKEIADKSRKHRISSVDNIETSSTYRSCFCGRSR